VPQFTPPNINETPVAISGANQNAIALSVDEGINGTMSSSDSLVGAVVDGGSSTPSVFDFASTKLLDYVKQGAAANANLPAGITQSENFPCDSGSITLSATVADPDSGNISAGDSFSMRGNNCVDNFDGTTLNGSISLTIVSGYIPFDPECFSGCPDFSAAMSFNNFRITEGGFTAAIHGGFTLALSETSGTSSFSGTSLFLIAGADAIHLTDFNISSALISGDTATSSSVNITIASTLIDGSISFETTVDIEQVIGQDHPYTGTVVVTGAGGETLTIDYVGQFAVDLTLDTDGAGATPPNATVTVLWADM